MPDAIMDSSSMKQVRDLLFGNQLKEVDNHMKRQEEQFNRELAALREDVKTRLASLENFMKSETSALLNRLQKEETERIAALKGEQQERSAALAQHAKDLAALSEAFERRVSTLSGNLDQNGQELRRLLRDEHARLSATMEEKYNDALTALSHSSAHIREDMVDKNTISRLLAELAVKISGDSPPNDTAAEDPKPKK